MTREQAYKIAKAVDDIEAFECFADMIEGTINQGIEIFAVLVKMMTLLSSCAS